MKKTFVLSEAATKRGKVKAIRELTNSQNEKQIMRKAWNANCETVISYK